MKSVIIKDINGQKLFHIKKDSEGVTALVSTEISDKVSITVVTENLTRIKLHPKVKK